MPYEIWSLDPDTGKFLWYAETVESEQANSSVVAADGVAYAIGGRNGGSAAVRTGGEGEVTDTHTVWKGRDSNRFGTPLLYEGRIYIVSNGIVSCIEAKSGDQVFQSRLGSSQAAPRGGGGQQGRFGGGRGRGGRGGDYSSPILAGGKIYFVRMSGETVVLDAGSEFKQLAVNKLGEEGETFMATPAASNGQLFIRSNQKLYCVATE